MGQSVHAYDRNGNPHHSLSLAQAKKEGLFLSVTTMQNCLAKPALEFWKLNEHLKTAFHNPPRDGEILKDYVKRMKTLNWRNSGGAAKLGTAVHDAIESVLRGDKKLEDIDVDLRKYVAPPVRYFKEKKFEIMDLEAPILNAEEGYGGTLDCAARSPAGQPFCLDWKTTSFRGRKTITPYLGQPEQVAAYWAAYWGIDLINAEKVWGANAYISTDEFDENGESKLVVVSYTPTEMKRHYSTYCLTAELWRRIENYDPR